MLVGYRDMPLIDRSDSLLTIVDTQPGFFDQAKMTDEERASAAAAVERIAWLAGLASLIDVPAVVVEQGADRNGATEPRVLERLGPDSAVHSKPTFSLTGCDAAVEAVRATRRSTVVLVGFETDVCVAQSASAYTTSDCGQSSSRTRRTRRATSTVEDSPGSRTPASNTATARASSSSGFTPSSMRPKHSASRSSGSDHSHCGSSPTAPLLLPQRSSATVGVPDGLACLSSCAGIVVVPVRDPWSRRSF